MSIRAALNPINNSIRTDSVNESKFNALKNAKDLKWDFTYNNDWDIIEIQHSSIELWYSFKEVITYTNWEVTTVEVIES